MKVVKSDWHNKLNEEYIDALLNMKIEGPKREEFIKQHSRDIAIFWWDAKERRKGGNGKWKKYKKRSRKTKRVRFRNESIDAFLESSSDEDEGNVI